MPDESKATWMKLEAFGWLRRPELDAKIAHSGERGVAWETPSGALVWLVPGRRFFLRRINGGFELGNEDYVRQNG